MAWKQYDSEQAMRQALTKWHNARERRKKKEQEQQTQKEQTAS